MKFIIVLLIASFFTPPAHAGFWEFCQNHLIAEDPWPFAESKTEELLDLWEKAHSSEALKELVFRLKANMLSTWEKKEFWRIANSGRIE
jgi:hypothetical protein